MKRSNKSKSSSRKKSNVRRKTEKPAPGSPRSVPSKSDQKSKIFKKALNAPPNPAPKRFDPKKALRKHLDERLRNLYDRSAMIEKQLISLEDHKFYRTCIFGSARIKPDTKLYKDVANLARYLAWEGIDVLTGGGPGLMEAGNQGAASGRLEKKTRSMTYGLSIELPFEPNANMHLDVKRHHHKFSSRLDDFMRLSHSIVVTPGGIGTVLELFFAWQLIQVKHIERRPIVLLDSQFWQGLLDWMREFPLDRKLVSAEDFDVITTVDTPEDAAEVIIADHRKFRANTSTLARV